jgi:hypothetical protein
MGNSSGDFDLGLAFAALPGATAVFAADAPRFTVVAASDALSPSPTAGATPSSPPSRRGVPEREPADPGGRRLSDLRGSLEAAVRTGALQHMPRQRYDLERPDGAWEERYWDAVNTPYPGRTRRQVCAAPERRTSPPRCSARRHTPGRSTARAPSSARIADAYIVLDRDFRFVDVKPGVRALDAKTRESC